jgi:hypothetical protein
MQYLHRTERGSFCLELWFFSRKGVRTIDRDKENQNFVLLYPETNSPYHIGYTNHLRHPSLEFLEKVMEEQKLEISS